MKHILMLATGGTIASRETGQGLAPAITSREILGYVPAIGELCRVETIQLMNPCMESKSSLQDGDSDIRYPLLC